MPDRKVRAEITGTIITVERQVGDQVEGEDVILIMESMKMEMPVFAPAAGRIVEIHVADGDTVVEGQLLAKIAT